MKSFFSVIPMFFLCFDAYASSFKDGDFDLDEKVDKIEITHNGKIHLDFIPSSTMEKMSYDVEYLNDSDSGYTDLYKYANKNYIVSYYSDYRGSKQYTENLYKWNSKINNFVLYINANIDTVTGVGISSRVAKCCSILGDTSQEPNYMTKIETAEHAKQLINKIGGYFKQNSKEVNNITREEIYLISNYYEPKYINTFKALMDFENAKGDVEMIELISATLNGKT